MTLFIFAPLYCIVYAVLLNIYSLFFRNAFSGIRNISGKSILAIFTTSILVGIAVMMIPDYEWGNRIQHAIGGGFIAYLVCFLVARDLKLKLGWLQFVSFSFLVVCALGVANEILEFYLQNFAGMLMARSINDTWLDLISNTIGALAGALIFFRKKYE